MKYLKHILSILVFFTIDQFILEYIAVYVTTVFNGSITFMVLCLLLLQTFLISFIVLWMKKEVPLNLKFPKWKWFYLYFFLLVILLSILEAWVKNIFHNFIVLAPSVSNVKLPSSVYLKGGRYFKHIVFHLCNWDRPYQGRSDIQSLCNECILQE